MLKYLLLFLILIFNFTINNFSQELEFDIPLKIEANSGKGFYWPYLVFIPKHTNDGKYRFFVTPNNTGKTNDSLEVHEASALKTLERVKLVNNHLKTILLIPVFPRSSTNSKIYTHALDRDVMLTENDSLKRLDLQLIAMINDARERLSSVNILTEEKILMFGFSASGMFVNRFSFLHPEMVLAAAVGSPGGWPMVPEKKYNNNPLNYPVGIHDFTEITGKVFDKNEFIKINQFFFLGDEDENDSVIFDDSYDDAERDVILKNFGEDLQERWSFCSNLYEKNNCKNVRFKIYEGVGHTINNEILNDILSFFINASER